MLVRCLVTLVVWAGVVAQKQQKFVMEPEDQTAVVQTKVTLPCKVVDQAGLLQWTKDGFGLGNLTGYNRYSLAGNPEDGDYSLDINPVELDDDAIYKCQIGAGPGGELPLISRGANLSVLKPPEPPKIIQGSYLQTTEDREIELECVSVGGKPPAEITWIDGVGNVLRNNIEYIVEPLSDHKTFTARSILKLVPKKEHHNMTLTCQSQNKADPTYRSARIRLYVKYAPKVRVTVEGRGQPLMEGQDVLLSCFAHANPPDVSYRWYIQHSTRETQALGDPTTELLLTKISRELHKGVVRCEVQNVVGRSEDSHTLDISYGPVFRVKPYDIQAEVGSTVTLYCDVDGNPTPSIVWIHEDTGRRGNVLTFTWEQVVSTTPNLTLTVAQQTSGRYFCRATVPGFPDIRAEANVYMKGPPTIISHRTQYGVVGDTVNLECSAFSIPTPQRVVWSFKGLDVGSDTNYLVSEDQLKEGIKSTLVIHESRLEHFGVYNCTVSNHYGSDVVEITLKAQKSFPIQSTMIGIMVSILGFVAMLLTLMLCQRKKKRHHANAKESSKYPRESDGASNLSDIKVELEYSGSGSETGSEGRCRPGLPLAGPVPLDQRYSRCYSDIDFPPMPNGAAKNDGQNNNGYVPYVNYARDYNPSPLPKGVSPVPTTREEPVMDPRYSAVYGNPYLCQAPTPGLPPPPGLPPTGPPPYNGARATPTLATHV